MSDSKDKRAPTDLEMSVVDAVRHVITGIGLELDEQDLDDTPGRFIKYLREFNQPIDVEQILGTKFPCHGHHNMVVQKNIPFRMVCAHHLLPATGTASIGYVPHNSIVGLSKLTRLVQAVGVEKPSLQEHICARIAQLLEEYIAPKGVIVMLQGEHGCMAARGVNTPGVPTITSTVHGVFRDVPAARAEFFSLIQSV